MPRQLDTSIEERITAAAMRLLDEGGPAAITMRSVAKQAGTTTPTVYQRFEDREALLAAVVLRGEQEMLAVFSPTRGVEKLVAEFLRFSCRHRNRFDLNAETFGARLVRGAPMPVYEMLKSRLREQVGVTGRKREDLALAVASLAIGTSRAMIAAGCDTHHGKELQRTCLAALRLLLAAFSKVK